MSSLDPSVPESWPPKGVPPLTLCKEDGTPYVRFPDVESEMQTVLAAPPSTWQVKDLKSEVIVHLIRVLRRYPKMVNELAKLFDELGKRTAVIVGDNSKGFSRLIREEFADQVGLKVVELVLREVPTRKSDFLEIAFRETVKGLALNMVDKRRREPRPHQFAPFVDDKDGDDESHVDGSVVVPDKGPSASDIAIFRETNTTVWDVLNSLNDPRHREAFILYRFEGWPITDQNPDKPTLSKHFQRSEKQIRNWIRAVTAKIKEATGETYEQ